MNFVYFECESDLFPMPNKKTGFILLFPFTNVNAARGSAALCATSGARIGCGASRHMYICESVSHVHVWHKYVQLAHRDLSHIYV